MGRPILLSGGLEGPLQSTSATRAHAKRMRAEHNWCCEHATKADQCYSCIHPPAAKIQSRGPSSSSASSSLAPDRIHHHHHHSRIRSSRRTRETTGDDFLFLPPLPPTTTAPSFPEERTVIDHLIARREQRAAVAAASSLPFSARTAGSAPIDANDVQQALAEIRRNARRREREGDHLGVNLAGSDSLLPEPSSNSSARLRSFRRAPRNIPIESEEDEAAGLRPIFRSDLAPADDVAILRTNTRPPRQDSFEHITAEIRSRTRDRELAATENPTRGTASPNSTEWWTTMGEEASSVRARDAVAATIGGSGSHRFRRAGAARTRDSPPSLRGSDPPIAAQNQAGSENVLAFSSSSSLEERQSTPFRSSVHEPPSWSMGSSGSRAYPVDRSGPATWYLESGRGWPARSGSTGDQPASASGRRETQANIGRADAARHFRELLDQPWPSANAPPPRSSLRTAEDVVAATAATDAEPETAVPRSAFSSVERDSDELGGPRARRSTLRLDSTLSLRPDSLGNESSTTPDVDGSGEEEDGGATVAIVAMSDLTPASTSTGGGDDGMQTPTRAARQLGSAARRGRTIDSTGAPAEEQAQVAEQWARAVEDAAMTDSAAFSNILDNLDNLDYEDSRAVLRVLADRVRMSLVEELSSTGAEREVPLSAVAAAAAAAAAAASPSPQAQPSTAAAGSSRTTVLATRTETSTRARPEDGRQLVFPVPGPLPGSWYSYRQNNSSSSSTAYPREAMHRLELLRRIADEPSAEDGRQEPRFRRHFGGDANGSPSLTLSPASMTPCPIIHHDTFDEQEQMQVDEGGHHHPYHHHHHRHHPQAGGDGPSSSSSVSGGNTTTHSPASSYLRATTSSSEDASSSSTSAAPTPPTAGQAQEEACPP